MYCETKKDKSTKMTLEYYTMYNNNYLTPKQVTSELIHEFMF